jgi:hypothetical protein
MKGGTMPKKEPLQGGEPVQDGDTPTKIPTSAVIGLEQELAGLEHGIATLVIHVRDGRLARFTTGRERSHMAESPHE